MRMSRRVVVASGQEEERMDPKQVSKPPDVGSSFPHGKLKADDRPVRHTSEIRLLFREYDEAVGACFKVDCMFRGTESQASLCPQEVSENA